MIHTTMKSLRLNSELYALLRSRASESHQGNVGALLRELIARELNAPHLASINPTGRPVTKTSQPTA